MCALCLSFNEESVHLTQFQLIGFEDLLVFSLEKLSNQVSSLDVLELGK